MTLSVLVVSGDGFARSGLTRGLDCAVVAVSDRDDVAATLARDPADVVLWDVGTGELARRRLTGIDVPVVVLASTDEQAVSAVAIGVRGVIDRDGDPDRLLPALQAVASGMFVVDEVFAADLVRRPDSSGTVEALTPREQEVLQLLSEGLSNKQIASALDISDHTAKFHVNAILGKLGAENRTEAVVRAARQGLLVL